MSRLSKEHSLRRLSPASIFTSLLILLSFVQLTTAGVGLQAAAIAQSFETDETDVVEGTLMSLRDSKPGSVELASVGNSHQLVGVVGKDPEPGDGEESSAIQIITNGITLCLVSDIEGDIKTGDKITASPVLGIGSKAEPGVMVVGTAQADLSSTQTTEHSINDVGGTAHTVKIGLIPIQVDVAFYVESGEYTYIPSFVQEFADSVAGKQVSPIRVAIAVLILLLAFLSIAVLLYAAVKSSIISIGRNPLSAVSVRKSMLQAGLAIVGILAGSVVIVLLVLRT